MADRLSPERLAPGPKPALAGRSILRSGSSTSSKSVSLSRQGSVKNQQSLTSQQQQQQQQEPAQASSSSQSSSSQSSSLDDLKNASSSLLQIQPTEGKSLSRPKCSLLSQTSVGDLSSTRPHDSSAARITPSLVSQSLPRSRASLSRNNLRDAETQGQGQGPSVRLALEAGDSGSDLPWQKQRHVAVGRKMDVRHGRWWSAVLLLLLFFGLLVAISIFLLRHRLSHDYENGVLLTLPYKNRSQHCSSPLNVAGNLEESERQFIYKGDPSAQSQYPYAAMVRLSLEGQVGTCGATILDSRHVLTASHCVYHPSRRTDDDWFLVTPDYMRVYVGSVRFFDKLNRLKLQDPQARMLMVESVYIHPAHRISHRDPDIAVIRLQSALVFNDRIKPVCIAGENETFGKWCTVIGWGNLGSKERGAPQSLQEAVLTAHTAAQCSRPFLGYLCSGQASNGGAAVCFGDSGGPLLCTDQFHDSSEDSLAPLMQFSLVSYARGSNCEATLEGETYYTDLRPWRAWLELMVLPLLAGGPAARLQLRADRHGCLRQRDLWQFEPALLRQLIPREFPWLKDVVVVCRLVAAMAFCRRHKAVVAGAGDQDRDRCTDVLPLRLRGAALSAVFVKFMCKALADIGC